MRKTVIVMIAAAAAFTAGCSDTAADDVAPAPPTEALAAAEADDTDVTADLKAAAAGQPWGALITSATKTELERVTIATTIVDPRGGTSGSSEALQAIDVCNGTVAWLRAQGIGTPKVSVMESNGTSFVLFGHPSYPGDCTEV